METWDLDCIEHIEEFKLILLNRSNKVLGLSSLSKDGTSSNVVDVKLLLQYAIQSNANAIIICHNHTSDNLLLSETDIANTWKVKDSAKFMEIQLLDHLIIIPEGKFLRMADEGLI